MRRNNCLRFDPRKYEEHLSPFGRTVLATLIKQRSAAAAARDRNLNNHSQHNHQRYSRYSSHNFHQRILTFEDQSTSNYNRTNNFLSTSVNFEPDLNDNGTCEVPTSDNCVQPVLSPTTGKASVDLSAYSSPTSPTSPNPLVFLPPPYFPDEPINRATSGISAHVPFQLPFSSHVTTSAKLVNPVVTSNDQDQIFLTRDNLITSLENTNIINESRDIFNHGEDAIETQKQDNTIDDARNLLKEHQINGNVNWDDMFDTELIPKSDLLVKHTRKIANDKDNEKKFFDIQFPDDKQYGNIHVQINKGDKKEKAKTDIKKPKRKNQSKVTDTIPKKVKKTKTVAGINCKNIPKSSCPKEKNKQAFNNWLDDVDPNNPVEECLAHLEEEKQIPNNVKEKIQLVIQKGRPEKRDKKIVQAQLANKGGIMKFGKPTKNIDEQSKEANVPEASSSENKAKDKEKVKDKKAKSKFVAPIKSQIPVKDITYDIIEIDETNILTLETITGKDIIFVLLFSNGFCQLNSQHTDDACIPEAVIFHTNDSFFYLKEESNNIVNVLSKMLQSNTIVCYDGKALLIYLSSKFELEFNIIYTFNVIDVKIAGHLLEPDSPPETFSSLLSLSGSDPDYTIATTCVKQKTAWYAMLLSSAATAIRSKLEQQDLWQVFIDIEMRILPIIADMEQRGVCVDLDKLKEMEKTLVAKMKQVESECMAAAGRTFQINSTLQVRALLYDELRLDEKAGLKVRGTLTTGAKSTSETTLRSLVSLHPLPRLILEYRHLHKAHATFAQGIAQYVRGGIIRPVWEQTAAATGRIACSNPNLQAIPKVPFNLRLFPQSTDEPAGEALRFRCVYVARAGHVLLAADWRHVECRVFARAAADSSLQTALQAPDLFRRLAADWLQKPEEDISAADRERTKRIVYASLYGAGPRKLMDILNVDYAQALSIAASFDSNYLDLTGMFPSLRSFGRRVAAQCLESGGRVATLCGRARTLPNIASADPAQRGHAERQALNFIVQGSAADVCKLAMSAAVEALRGARGGVRARLLLQIHDELVWEVDRSQLPQAAEVIRTAMEQCGSRAGLTSLPVALAVGPSWGELTPYPPTDGWDDCDSQPPEFEF